MFAAYQSFRTSVSSSRRTDRIALVAAFVSCTLGGCGACRVRAQGPVAMAEPSCLADHERAAGDVLACVATARGHVTVEVP